MTKLAERADVDLTALYRAHYASLVRLGGLLLGDVGAAEEIVQDAYVGLSRARLDDPDRALAYLRRSVVNGSRSRIRRLVLARRHSAVDPPPDVPSAEQFAVAADTRRTVMAALRKLPRRQREVLVLRYYGDLSESEIAAALGIAAGSVKAYASRGLAALETVLEVDR